MSQEKSKTMPMQIFFFFFFGGGGVKEVYYGICASSELRSENLYCTGTSASRIVAQQV